MSTDYEDYTGTTLEGLVVNVTCRGFNETPEVPRLNSITTLNDLNLGDEGFDLSLLEIVRSGKITLTHTGGWCSSGGVWDAEGNDLVWLHTIRDAYSLIQSVDPETLRKALELSA